MQVGALLSQHRKSVASLATLVYLFMATPSGLGLIAGTVFIVVGLALRLWASGQLRADDELATTGAFSIIRHPTEFGSLLIGLGCTAFTESAAMMFAYGPLHLWVTLPAMVREERRMQRIFGDAAVAYFKRVPRFVPAPTGFESSARRWQLDICLTENREWRAWLFAAALWGFGWLHRL